MKNIFKRATALLLSLLMVFSVCSTSLVIYAQDAAEPDVDLSKLLSLLNAEEEKKINYVSFGASNVNGFGLYGYLPADVYEHPESKDKFNIYGYKITPEGSYPDLLVKYFESKGYDVDIDQLAMSSMRAEEVRMMFDDTYNGDAYTEWRFTGGEKWFYGAGKLAYAELNNMEVSGHSDPQLNSVTFDKALAALRQVYQNDVANADIITWDVGINNFGVYLSGRVVNGDYNDPIESISPEAAAFYDEAKAYVFDMAKQELGEEMFNNLIKFGAEHILDSLAYCLVAYCVNYDIAMEKIYALNPDVTVVNVSIQNLMKGLVAEIPGIDGQVPLGDLVAMVINAANTYMAKYSPYADRGYYANVSEDQHVTFFIDQLADYNGDPTTLDRDMVDCWRVYNYGGNMLQALEPFVFDEDGKLIVGPGGEALYYMQLVAMDAVAKYLKVAAKLNVIHFDVLAGGNWGSVSSTGMNAIGNAVGAEVNRFGAHLQGSGTYENFERIEVKDDFWTTLANANDIDVDLMDTFAAYGVRTFIGNAFYAHPNRVGLQEICDIIVEALENKITGEQVFDENATEVMVGFYNFLENDTSMSTSEKVDLLGGIYSIFRANVALDADSEKMIKAVEDISIYLDSNGLITDEQTLDIVLCIYEKLLDKELTNYEIRYIAYYIYCVVLNGTKPENAIPFAARRGGVEDAVNALTAKEKLAVIDAVYKALVNNEVIDNTTPEMQAFDSLYTDLIAAPEGAEALLSAEASIQIIENVITSLGTTPEVTPDVIQEIATDAVEVLVTSDMPIEDKLTIIEKVTGAIQDSGLAGGTGSEGGSSIIPAIPDLGIAKTLTSALKAEGLLTDAEINALLGKLMEVVLAGDVDPMTLVDDLYEIFYGTEGFDAVRTVKIVIVVTTVLYEEGLIYTYGNPYYAEAMAKVLTEENVKTAKVAVDAAIKAIEQAIEYLSKSARGGIETDTTALKAALIAELEATLDTLEKIELVLENNVEDLKDLKGATLVLLTFESDLWAHIDNISDIVLEAGLIADPYILAAIDAVNSYAQIVDQRVQDAYAWVVNGVVEFNADYLALVEKIGAEVDKIDPVLGEAVRKFMIEAPADTLYILYVYGEDAVNELIDRALVYGDAVATAAVELARVLNKYGVTIYNAIMESGACQDLYDELLGVVDQILALEEQIKKPSDIEDVALDIYSKLDKLQAYALDLAVRFYNAAIAAVKADDYLAGTELEEALTALVAALATIDDEAIDYGEWIADHAAEMGGALLTAFLANWDELYEVAEPIIIREAKNIYNQVKDYILNYDYEALIQQIIDAAIKFAPELDAMLYDYFYNNPDEVIAFFNEYGDEIVDLCKKYGAPVLAVIGVALAAYGPELADYIINNPEEVLAGLSAWAEKYGDRVVAILQVYAEALGICDAVRNEIEDLKADLAALQAQLAVLNEQLKTATGEVRDAIEAEIAKVQAEIAKVQAKIAEFVEKLQALEAAINNLNAALKYFVTDVIGGYTLVIDALNNLDDAIRALLDLVSDDLADKLAGLMQNGIELTKDMIKDLAQLAVESVIKFAPELDEYLYNYFYNNPEEVIAFFNEYGDEIVDLCKKYGDKALGVIALALAYYGDDLAEYIMNNPEEVLAGLNAWADKYGDRVVAILQVYAEALGVCDAVRNEIEDLKADLAALQAQLAVLNEQLKTAVGEVRDAIEAEIARVQAEIAKVQAKIAELQQKLQNLVNAIYNLDDALKKFATEAIEFATAAVVTAIANLENAVKELLDSVSDDVADKLRDLIKTGVGLTIDLLADLAKLAVDAAIKFAPELDEYLYNYFYNNPEEVIAFFNEYGDEIIELCERYGDKVLGIIAIALAYAGPELAEYIINNPKEVLEGLSAWADKYGAKVVAILQVYAEALGLCDAVRGEVAELNNKLAALQAELMNQLNILQNELQAELDALYAQLENATEAAKVIILEKIKEIESKIELVQKYIAELQAKIAELQVKIAEINAKLQALIDALYNLDDALKALLETGVEAGVAAVQKALNEVANAVRDVIGVISDDIAAQIDKLLQKAKDYLNDAYHSAIIADYVINSNSNYVALGDNEEYAKLFAQYLKDTVAAENVGYNYKVNTALVQNGSKISTLPVIINENLGTIAAADLISIGYSFDKVAEDTILMAIELLMDGKTSVPTDYDWTTIVGAEAAAEIEKLVGEIYTYMLNEGLGITVSEATSGMFDHNVTIADIAIIAVQYFVYNVVEYAAYLPQAVNAISQINPDAIIMINAISNPISGAKLSFFGQELVFGDYLDYVCDAIYVETAVLAAIYENVVFVPTTEIETTFTNRTISFNSSKDFIALAELLTALMENQAINTTPNGNAYACQKMTEALNITVEDGGLLGDVNGDGVVDYIDAILILRYEVGFVDPKFIAGVADVDRDGYIGYVDAIWVLKYEAGLEKEFPASK